MKLSWLRIVLVTTLAVSGSWLGTAAEPACAAEPMSEEQSRKLFDEARELQRDGKGREAFLTYLRVPGGETAALAVARTGTSAGEFLELLKKHSDSLPAAQAKLVEGELSLAQKNREWALACFREAARLISRKRGAEPEPGMLPREDYFVEIVQPGGNSYYELDQVFTPFTHGPGSHRDNRLIRRFIALEAWDDAAREFARVWELHREAARPFVRGVPIWIERDVAMMVASPADALHAENVDPVGRHQFRWEKRLFRPTGFNGQGLQFALDYAFFLQRRHEPVVARHVLLEPLLALDMDRDPNAHSEGELIPAGQPLPAPERPDTSNRFGLHYGRASGVSRKEFIRLVYGDFQTRSETAELVSALNDQITKGENRARRTLARIRGHQGSPDESLALELAYIAAGRFDPIIAAYRTGLVLDEARKIAEATAEFERVLTLPMPIDGHANVPDPDEVFSNGYGGQAGGQAMFRTGHDAAMNPLHELVIDHLQRLYAAQGETNKLLDITLREAESLPQVLTQVESLEQLVQKFRAAKQEERITDWIKQRLAEATNQQAIAALAWVTGDHARAAEAVATLADPKSGFVHSWTEPWKERFRKAGADEFQSLLKLIVQANPRDGRSRLELLELEGKLDGVEVIESLTLLLASDAAPAFVRGKGERNRTQFSGYCDLAYRLMRQHERHDQLDELRQLGLRIAREEKPFDRLTLRRSSNDSEEENELWGNACLALAIQHANDPADQTALAEALTSSQWPAARNQIARRMAGAWKPQPAANSVPWANAPAGVSLLVSHDNVLCLAHDDRFVYSGHPWGVAVYSHDGQVVTQIALAEAARVMVVQGEYVWVGTPKGLFRITPGDWSVAHQPLKNDIAGGHSFGSWHDNGITALAVDGDLLWMGLLRNVQVLDTKKLERRAFSQEELHCDQSCEVQRIMVDGRYVWAVGKFGTRRWDRTTDEWSAIEPSSQREPTRLIAIIKGTAFGDVYLDDRRQHRLCVIDRETLAVTPIPVIARPDREIVNSTWHYLGQSLTSVAPGERHEWDGKLFFASDHHHFFLDEATRQLKPIPESIRDKLHERVHAREEQRSAQDRRKKSVLRMLDQRDEWRARIGIPLVYDWSEITLPNGTLVAGHRLGNTRYEYPQEDRPSWSDSLRDLGDEKGGLYFVTGGDQARNVTRMEAALRAEQVHGLLTTDEQAWLCTNRWLVVLNRNGQVLEHFSRGNGLCANRVVGGAKLGERYYFATAWEDSSGGLAVFDPRTATFTSLHESDGLSTDKLRSIAVKGERLTLEFDIEYLRNSRRNQFDWRQHPPATFDPQTNSFTSQGKPTFSKNEQRYAPQLTLGSMSCLGGHVLHRRAQHGKAFVCGTRGAAIMDEGVVRDGKLPELVVASLGAKLVPSVASQQLADAKSRPIKITDARELMFALQDENPLYRANALASLYGQKKLSAREYVPLIAPVLNDRHRRLRCTAFFLLTTFDENELVVPLLQARLKDDDRLIRHAAIVELTKRGSVPDLALLRDFFRSENDADFPFGAESKIGARTGHQEMHIALAPHATKDIFRLMLQMLLQNPPHTNAFDDETKLFPQLGRSLMRFPDAVAILLEVRAEDGAEDRKVAFVREVFRCAGKELLPALHAALKSEDRVIRSNAARGCGAISDPSSIEPLLKALDLESGLSRASIVWALGELKAKAALPILVRLYVDARNDEQRRDGSSGAGFRASQSGAVMAAQFDTLKSLDAIGADWNELKSSAFAPLVDPRHQEELFEPRHVLEAVEKIGGDGSQAFYRTLAAESDDVFRSEAAIQLAEAGPQDRKLNLPILKSLLTGSTSKSRLAAAASLLILGDNDGRQPILDAFQSEEWGHALKQLERVGSDRCAFAHKELKAIANDPGKPEEIRARAARLSK